MSCFTCQSKFTWRKKELGCKNCGKAFCKDCLKHNIFVPKLKAEEHVCNNCFKELTTKKQKSEPQQRSHGCVDDDLNIYFGPSMKDIVGSHERTLADPNAAILARLKKLKECETNKPATEEDIRLKFQQVTGRDAHSSRKSNILTPQKKLTEAEEIANLLKQTQEEVGIDQRHRTDDSADGSNVHNKIDEMEDRLSKLRGIDPVASKRTQENDSSEDEYEATKKVIKKALAEAQLDDKVNADGYGDLISGDKTQSKFPDIPSTAPGTKKYTFAQNTASDDEELPWCCICNADATLRCHDCDDDLYCRRCFREGHDEYDMKYHKTSSYKPPKKKR